MSYLLRSAALTNYVEVARLVGLDPYQQLGDAGIERSVLLDPDIMIPAEAVARLLETSARAAAVEDLGLRMAETRHISNLGALGFVMREQPTLRKALESAAYYLRLQNEAVVMRFEESEGLVVIREEIVGVPGSMRQATELVLGVLYRVLHMVLDAVWKPRAVCFTHHAPAGTTIHARIFGAAVEFNQDFDGIVCLASELDAAIPAYDPVMAQQVRRYLDSMLLQSGATMPDKIRKLVVALLPSGACSNDRIAQHLGVDRRTVNRHLAAYGESYLSIVDSVRVEMVTRYVGSGNRPLSEVASLLGFSSLSAFSRWFGGRFGCSVSVWRRENRQRVIDAGESGGR
ncbi:AraC family transcriptional regulator ligand-binding domain-containing protein [Paraburkholderia sabiae]|uniref:AraC family transcriptional regulator n=1 Tax=Paraburkholderia sabiae TaxID=273251 RepID=A0ABU9QQU5_9BURK|nr:AraC family transcriptional regulator [Paraburkholderia sabiae]WJZ72310.1 AraC family transcriptional regulator [Paraburkholderia sabiae]CAD6537909.1 HTH-type transcriptional regulator VirS [Paraburkholderia sabiae]